MRVPVVQAWQGQSRPVAGCAAPCREALAAVLPWNASWADLRQPPQLHLHHGMQDEL